MTRIQFYLLDIIYKTADSRPIIHLYGRTIDGKQICAIDTSFRPYFYAIPKSGAGAKDKIRKLELEYDHKKFHVVDVEVVSKYLIGQKKEALKIYVNLPKGVPLIKDILKDWDSIESVYEYDIKFTRRYLIDKGITPLSLIAVEGEIVSGKSKIPMIEIKGEPEISGESMQDMKVLAMDIETYNPRGKRSNPDKDPIIMIGLYSENFEKVITWKEFKTKETFIEFVKSEAELLERFKEAVESFKPDIITGYFSDGFDFPYILKRARKYKLEMDIGLDFSEPSLTGRAVAETKITGIIHLDIFQFIRRVISRSLKTDTYTLSAVTEELLGEQKAKVDIENLVEVWDKHLDELEAYCKYNLRDAQLTYDLCVKLLPNIIEFVKIIGLPIHDLTRMSFSQLVEWFIIKQTSNFNEIILNKPLFSQTEDRLKKSYQAAFVYEPKSGLYQNIAIFDFRSLYPSIIVSYNVSPDTMNCECCEEIQKAPLETKRIWFCTKKKGFLPSILEDLITRRMRIKEIIKKSGNEPLLAARSEALKVLSNSFSGYLGFYAARWYSIECIESATAWGRYHINKLIDTAKEKGFDVLYGDTDSVFLLMGEKTRGQAEAFLEHVNSRLPGLMELEFDGFYPMGIFVNVKFGAYGAKKKYALLDENNKITIKGFETIRRNWSLIAKETQKHVIKIILETGQAEKALGHVRDVIADLKNNNIPIDKVILHTRLQKELDDYGTISPHVAAAKLMQEKGIDVGTGSVIKFIIGKGAGKIRDRIKLPEDSTQQDYDPDYYINNQVIPSVERLFSVFGYSNEDFTGQKQSTLGSFVK